MAASATNTYSAGGIQPAMYPELARTDAVKLAVGTYAKGTVIGQNSTLTTANEVQTITFTGTPTGGTFTLSFGGQVTAAITYSTTAATLQANILAALAALSTIGSTSNIAVSASATVPTVTFQGAMAGLDQPMILVVANALTGGTTPALSVAETTKGRTVGGGYAAYNDSLSDGTNVAKAILQYDTVVDTFGKYTVGGGEWGGTQLSAPAFFRGYFKTAELTGLDANGVADFGRLVQGSLAAGVLEVY